jgi:hypothetical protein
MSVVVWKPHGKKIAPLFEVTVPTITSKDGKNHEKSQSKATPKYRLESEMSRIRNRSSN